MYTYIYISFKYPIRWQKLRGSARSGSTALRYRNCVITLVGGWWGYGIAHAFTRCMMKKIFSCLFIRTLSVLWYCLVCVGPKFSLSLFESLYWGMLTYFLSWILLDVVHFCFKSYVGWICGFGFCQFGHSCLHQWRERCASECCEQERVTNHRRRWVQFLH